MSETLYQKRGRRYYPAAEYAPDSFPSGHHLVICVPGMRVTRYRIDPPYADLLAAAEAARMAMEKALVNEGRSYGHLQREPLTRRQAKVWEEWKRVCGSNGAVSSPSAAEIVDAAITVLIEKAAGVTK